MSPIINHQAVGYLLAEVAARIEAYRYMCWTAAEIFIVAMIALSAVVAGYESIRPLLAPQPIAWAPTPPSAVTVIFGRAVVGTSKVSRSGSTWSSANSVFPTPGAFSSSRH
ncbi:acyl-CoA dehydrogenase family protein [Pseudonocardia charpentierae]|uniref:Acyl-CoA dehydrogenase/oxidase C-terminal domain-containing protein n=1 Tax=Pseudonocardia charpentierae TaxID=3075545 RepID=A0ABU2NH41_9PSEU|nr:hypothetical protein [Pseudonocardia sp. DSM 45834]MDT0353276.1 hypothetical protein [Pseudonocardia sp. DSM 45834]